MRHEGHDTNGPGKQTCVWNIDEFCRSRWSGEGRWIGTVGGGLELARHANEARGHGFSRITFIEIVPETCSDLRLWARKFRDKTGTWFHIVLGDIFHEIRNCPPGYYEHVDADLTERISEDSVVPKMVDLGVAHPQTFVLVFTVRKDAEGRDAFGDKLGVPRTLNSGPEKVYRDKRDGVVRGHGATDPHCLPGPVLRAAAAKYLPEYEVEYFTYKGSCPPRSETTSGRMRSGSTMACLMGRLR